MNTLRIITCFLVLLITPLYGYCQSLQIDHVISIYTDLNEAKEAFTQKGFTIKEGHFHSNGLINAHIKFSNHSSFELMSLESKATDAISRNYEDLLNSGEGGVFIALTGLATDTIADILSNLSLKHQVIKGKLWNYITFNEQSNLAPFFFIESFTKTHDDSSLFKHKNGALSIKEVYVEGDDYTLSFFKEIGFSAKGIFYDSVYGKCERFSTKTGDIIIVPHSIQIRRPRVLTITFSTKNGDIRVAL